MRGRSTARRRTQLALAENCDNFPSRRGRPESVRCQTPRSRGCTPGTQPYIAAACTLANMLWFQRHSLVALHAHTRAPHTNFGLVKVLRVGTPFVHVLGVH